jgi:hypothetical protein
MTSFGFGLRSCRSAAVLIAAFHIASCGGGTDNPDHRVVRSEIDGVPVVRTEGAPLLGTPLFQVELGLVLGIDDGEPGWQIFGRFVWLEVGPDGRLYVGIPDENRIHIVSREGELQGTFGGKGEGPGEISRFLSRAWWVRGELWLDDNSLVRFQRFTPNGEFLGSVSYRDAARRYRYLTNVTDDVWLGYRTEGAPPEMVYEYGFLNGDLQFEEEFLTLEGQRMIAAGGDNTGLYLPTPFDYPSSLVPYRNGRILVVEPRTPRLTVYSPGEAREANPNPYTEAYLNRVQFPSHRAPFSRALTDDSGRAWVMRGLPVYEEDTVVAYDYDIFDHEGVWLGTQRLAEQPRFIQGDYFYVVTLGGEFEGPRIKRIRLVPLH